MDISLTWLIAGFILIIAELMTGTFYLLVLGIAALVGAGVGYASGALVWQAIGAAIVAVAGVIWVNQYKKKMMPQRMQGLDVGQPAAFDSWVNKSAGHARVKYRDALWDAQVGGDASGEPGEILYVTSVDGSTLKVSKTRPA
jgi:membrane protein implicated in regulation of membrane protease activity